jgi:predicted ATP-dependent protease
MISTTGSRVGQMNGLTVLAVGAARFGCPTRITAARAAGNSGASSTSSARSNSAARSTPRAC